MADWTSGYIADIAYTHGYFPELNPLRMTLPFLNVGLVPPQCGTACELGFGQGVSANIHAAASVTTWYGTDFNPSQASYAQELARASGAHPQLRDQAFEEFCNRADLPDFDYIGLHGIWSWINDENRAVIVDFIRRKLKVGGVVYVSYNTMPGWAAFAPMRHLITEHAKVIGSEGSGIISRIDGAIHFAEKLLETNPAYVQANPQVSERVKLIKSQNRHYLAHEFFNRDWHPMHFATMATWLSPAKLTYACSANYIDHIPAANLTTDQQAFLLQIPDTMMRQTVRDFMVNQQFRKDYWVKGPRTLSALDRSEELRNVKVVLLSQLSDVSLKVKGAIGEVGMSESIYSPILALLGDFKPHSLGSLESALVGANITLAQIVEACILLCGTGYIDLVQSEAAGAKVRKGTDKLNAHLIKSARSNADTPTLSSPVTGGGISVGRFQQLFLLGINQGRKTSIDLAAYVWQILAAQGQQLIKDGKALDTPEANLAELTQQADAFVAKQLPILKALQVV